MRQRLALLSTPYLAAVAAAVLAVSAPSADAAERPPNIILFLVDDMGWQDTSVPFHTEMTPLNRLYRTPNMERLAASGVKFTQAYACSVCSPTRVSLMTGLNAARHRVTNWTLRKDAGNDARYPTLEFPAWNVNGLSPVPGVPRTVYTVTLPALLKQAGYRTIHIGKAHFGAVDTPGADPRNLGFDVNVAGHAAGGPGSYLGTQNFSAAWRKGDRVWDVPGLEPYHGKKVFLTEALTTEANKAVDQAVADGKPFFLYMAHYAVHVPFAPDDRFYDKYRSAGLNETEAMYAALVEGMDKSLGDILANIDRHGLSERTVVLFLSDNGGLSAHGRGGVPHTHNKPLSSGKGSAHEGGIRVPMIVKWPGVAKAGSLCRQCVIVEDFFPSILEIAGVKANQPAKGKIDGVSFVPLLRQEGSYPKERSLFWHFPNCWGPKGPGIGPSSTIRRGDWKLIYYHADQSYELFNLAEDLGERRNRVGEELGVRRQLAEELARYLESVEAQMPRVKATGQTVPLPGRNEEQAISSSRRKGQPDGRPLLLFSYFRGNGEDGLHLASSGDGYHWTALNHDRSFLAPQVGSKLMRDPCLVQGPDGVFHMVWTTGWGDRAIGYASSRDLVHWSPQQAIPVMMHDPAARNAWAPELFYDEGQKQFLIFWASTIPGRFPATDRAGDDGWNHRIYATTTRDFKTFTPTRLFFDGGFNVIDATILNARGEYQPRPARSQ